MYFAEREMRHKLGLTLESTLLTCAMSVGIRCFYTAVTCGSLSAIPARYRSPPVVFLANITSALFSDYAVKTFIQLLSTYAQPAIDSMQHLDPQLLRNHKNSSEITPQDIENFQGWDSRILHELMQFCTEVARNPDTNNDRLHAIRWAAKIDDFKLSVMEGKIPRGDSRGREHLVQWGPFHGQTFDDVHGETIRHGDTVVTFQNCGHFVSKAHFERMKDKYDWCPLCLVTSLDMGMTSEYKDQVAHAQSKMVQSWDVQLLALEELYDCWYSCAAHEVAASRMGKVEAACAPLGSAPRGSVSPFVESIIRTVSQFFTGFPDDYTPILASRLW
jgi:hypothetical protein